MHAFVVALSATLAPDRLWVADITHIMVPNRYLHLNIGVFKTERTRSGGATADRGTG